jgi:hypothetical protein
VIVELNRKQVRSTDDFLRLSKSLGKDESALLLIVRQSRKLFVAINP